jgi:diguanylate cyclase (GGDEF)-like protein
VATELTFLIVSGVVGALLLLGAALALVGDRASRRAGRARGGTGDTDGRRDGGDKYDVGDGQSVDGGRTASGGMTRVLWWVTTAGVLVGTGLSDAFRANQAAIFALGGVAALAVIVLHELHPGRPSKAISMIEIGVAIALGTGLLLLTGYAASPFTFVLALVAVAAALAQAGWSAIATVALASLAYGGVVLADPGLDLSDGPAMLRVGLNVGAIWLLAALAGVFSAEERRMRLRLTRLWRIDPLTGLFNRGQLFPDLEQEVLRTRRSERSFSLLMVDLDGLKQVNDSLGHQRGDEVLRSLGRVIRDKIRSVDSAYRYGGDEFFVLLPETDYAGAFVVAEKIRAESEEVGRRLESEGAATSVSIGLVSYPEDASTAEELVRAADRAMYNAKALGRNQVSGFPRPVQANPGPGLFARGEVDRGDPPGGGESGPHEPPPFTGPHRPRTPAPDFGGYAAELPTREDTLGAGASRSPGATAAPPSPAVPASHDPSDAPGGPEHPDDGEPDAEVMRRNIATARLSFDPDHQIDAAMDVFLTPRVSRPPSAQDPPLPS